MAKSKVLEKDIQSMVLQFLRRVPYMKVTRHHPVRMKQIGKKVIFVKVHEEELGWADIIGCYRGRFVEFEIKRPGEDLSDDQKRHRADIELNAGGDYFRVDGLESLLDAIDKLKKKYSNGSVPNGTGITHTTERAKEHV